MTKNVRIATVSFVATVFAMLALIVTTPCHAWDLRIGWDAPAETQDLAHYRVEVRQSSGPIATQQVTALDASFTGLPDVRVYVNVYTVDVYGQESLPATLSYLPPRTVGGLRVMEVHLVR